MAKKNFDVQSDAKKSLGELISRLRKVKSLSLRQFAIKIDIPPSNVTYIEKGVNSPSSEVYARIVTVLSPKEKERKEMDKLYSIIRNVPPPDVCDILLKKPELWEKLKLLDGVALSDSQLESVETLFATFK